MNCNTRDLMLRFQKRPEDGSADQIKSFLVYSRDKQGLSSSSVNLRVCGIKYYCREVINRLDLVVQIPNPRIQKHHTEVLTLEEVRRLFGACRDIRQLLPTTYFYVVFTIPHELSPLCLHQSALMYNLLLGSKNGRFQDLKTYFFMQSFSFSPACFASLSLPSLQTSFSKAFRALALQIQTP